MAQFYVLFKQNHLIWFLTVLANTAMLVGLMARPVRRQDITVGICTVIFATLTYYRVAVHAFGIATMDGWFLSDQFWVLLELIIAYDLSRRFTLAHHRELLLTSLLWGHFVTICCEYEIAEEGDRLSANMVYYARSWAWIAIALLTAGTLYLRNQREEIHDGSKLHAV